jgi:predicted nucleic acid-binding protein
VNVVFADTYYYLAWINPRDGAHAAARQFAAEYRGDVITTSGVLLEVGDALCRSANRDSFLAVLPEIQDDPSVTLVQIDEALLGRGIELFRARPDKDWSLTDCISFVVMTELGLTDALTGDHHFEQAGFRALLQPDAGA